MANRDMTALERSLRGEEKQPAPVPGVRVDPSRDKKRPRTRVGRRSVACWVEESTYRLIKQAAARDGKTLQEVLSGAIENVLRAHGMPLP